MAQALDLPTIAATEAEAALVVSAESHTISCSLPIACSAATVFGVWSDVGHWHTWDPDTKWARLEQGFALGSTGKLAPQKGMAVTMRITELTPNQSFTAECRVLGNRMVFSHALRPERHGIVATHAVRFEGWAAGLFMRTIGKDVQRGLPLTMTRLKHLCELRRT